MRSGQPGEDWAWCYVDELSLRPLEGGGWEDVRPVPGDRGLGGLAAPARWRIAGAGRGLRHGGRVPARAVGLIRAGATRERRPRRTGESRQFESLPGWTWEAAGT